MQLIFLVFYLLSYAQNDTSKFVKGLYDPIIDDYCNVNEGYLKIWDVSKDSLNFHFDVRNDTFFGEADGRTKIQASRNAIYYFKDDEDPNLGIVTIEFIISPDDKYVYIREDPSIYLLGAGVYLSRFYKIQK